MRVVIDRVSKTYRERSRKPASTVEALAAVSFAVDLASGRLGVVSADAVVLAAGRGWITWSSSST